MEANSGTGALRTSEAVSVARPYSGRKINKVVYAADNGWTMDVTLVETIPLAQQSVVQL